MRRVCLDVIIPILFAIKLDDKGMSDAALESYRLVLDPGHADDAWGIYLQALRAIIFASAERFDVGPSGVRMDTFVLEVGHVGDSLAISNQCSVLLCLFADHSRDLHPQQIPPRRRP